MSHGIARFANRKIDSISTHDTAATTTPQGEKPVSTPAPTANTFPFATNDTSDALSTTSDDEFGFLGSGNSLGGEDFYFSDDPATKGDDENHGVNSHGLKETNVRDLFQHFIHIS